MNVFTEVYERSAELLKAPVLHADWREVESELKALLQTDGPDPDKGKVLDTLRQKLDSAAAGAGHRAKAKAQELARAANTGKTGFQDRAALLKQFKHVYMVSRKGAQTVWVVDQPKAYGQWNYDLFAGQSAEQLTDLMSKTTEVFGSGNRKMLSDALQQARKWSADTEVRLSAAAAETLNCVKRWFHEADADAAAVEATRLKLLAGFKKITAACNSGKVIFSDRPHLRASGDYDNTFASVNAGDAMPVIYIYQLFLDTGKRTLDGKVPKMWLCALTIVHELSHKLERTEDKRYDYEGLKPGGSFPAADALRNADSWAYFCADLLGHVPKAALDEAYA